MEIQNRERNNSSNNVLRDFMLFFNSIGIAVIITILCCNRCNPCCNPCNSPCVSTQNGWEHRCPSETTEKVITEVVRDTIYLEGKTQYVTKYITKTVPVYQYIHDTTFVYKYINDTIFVYKTDTNYVYKTVNQIDTVFRDKEIIHDKKPTNKETKHFSVYGGGGPLAHDIKPDEYTTPYYKFSYGGFIGMTYRFDNRIGINCEFNYSAPYQFLYNSQYVGVAGIVDYDILKSDSNMLSIGTGAEYDHSYNKRTINFRGTSTSTYLTTDNLYVPIKMSYEHDFNNVGIGIYARYRQNVLGQDLSHNYFLDGGIQLRYKFQK